MNSFGYLNDMWEFKPTTNQWTWITGSKAITCSGASRSNCGSPGIYGAQGIPAASLTPGARTQSETWTDSAGTFWLLGGYGYGVSGSALSELDDMWEFDPTTNEWAWIAGNQDASGTLCPGIYGTLGTPASSNAPGCRQSAASWTDSTGAFWLLGGTTNDANRNSNWVVFNDVWKYQPVVPLPATATPTFTLSNPIYATSQNVTISDATPGATIYYTSDGTTPTAHSPVYTSPITVSSLSSLAAFATAPGHSDSAINSGGYVKNVPNFIFTTNTSALSISTLASVPASVTLDISPVYNFNGTVSFTVSGMPSSMIWKFNPTTVTTGGEVAMLISPSTTPGAMNRYPSPLLPGSALAVALCLFGWKKPRRLLMLLLVTVSLAGLGLITSCGGGGSSASGTTTNSQPTTSWVIVTATSGSQQHSVAFTLTVD